MQKAIQNGKPLCIWLQKPNKWAKKTENPARLFAVEHSCGTLSDLWSCDHFHQLRSCPWTENCLICYPALRPKTLNFCLEEVWLLLNWFIIVEEKTEDAVSLPKKNPSFFHLPNNCFYYKKAYYSGLKSFDLNRYSASELKSEIRALPVTKYINYDSIH